ncbi:MAG: hypothetical protein R3B45_12655 [Bdellovibrionota bacterium]
MAEEVTKIDHSLKKNNTGPQSHIGIHLSGANAHKTSVVFLHGNLVEGPLIIHKLHEKIGSIGGLYSDDRLVDLVLTSSNIMSIFVDSPLTVPPCVSCVRPTCPGAISCDDLMVAYMLHINEKIRRLTRKRRRRPMNPQTHRLWDLWQMLYPSDYHSGEATFSANLIPLVIRAKSFAKRLYHQSTSLLLKETSVPQSLSIFAEYFCWDSNDIQKKFRSFEHGLQYREKIIRALIREGWLGPWNIDTHEIYQQVTRSVENFQALITGLVAGFYQSGLCHEAPDEFLDKEGWIYLPQLSP